MQFNYAHLNEYVEPYIFNVSMNMSCRRLPRKVNGLEPADIEKLGFTELPPVSGDNVLSSVSGLYQHVPNLRGGDTIYEFIPPYNNFKFINTPLFYFYIGVAVDRRVNVNILPFIDAKQMLDVLSANTPKFFFIHPYIYHNFLRGSKLWDSFSLWDGKFFTTLDYAPQYMFDDFTSKGKTLINLYSSTKTIPFGFTGLTPDTFTPCSEKITFKILDSKELFTKWSWESDFISTGDLAESVMVDDTPGFKLIGKTSNKIILNNINIYPEAIEYLALNAGATSAMVQVVNNKATCLYTGDITTFPDTYLGDNLVWKNVYYLPKDKFARPIRTYIFKDY